MFSVVITTRNRPDVFAKALASVLAQSHQAFELVVVEDGSDACHQAAYASELALARERLGARLLALHLPAAAGGHGSGGTMNVGVEAANGRYVAFLDDDDEWIDPQHLSRAEDSLLRARAEGRIADLYASNQEATRAGLLLAPAWLAPVQDMLRRQKRTPDAGGVYRIDVDDLLQSPGFCHTNCFIVRRSLYLQIGGRNASIRWEGDHNLYLRLLDKAGCILHWPGIVARHHVPDAAAAASVTTRLSSMDRRLWQARSMSDALRTIQRADLRLRAKRVRGYALKRAALDAATAGLLAESAIHAWAAWRAQPGLKWWLYSCWRSLRQLAPAAAHPAVTTAAKELQPLI